MSYVCLAEYPQETDKWIQLPPSVYSLQTKFKAKKFKIKNKTKQKKGRQRGIQNFFMFPFVQILSFWNLLAQSPGYEMKETLLQKQCLLFLKGAFKYAFIAAPRMISQQKT